MTKNTILIQGDKHLIVTQMRPIFQKESRADYIDFLVAKEFVENPKDYLVVLQVILPDNATGGQTGKLRYMTFEEDEYKDRVVMKLPITTTLTDNYGEVKMQFIFVNALNEELIKTMQTTLLVHKQTYSGSIDDDDDDGYDVLDDINQQLDDLRNDKLDKHFNYDPENNTLQFFVNGTALPTVIRLDDNVTWSSWDV